MPTKEKTDQINSKAAEAPPSTIGHREDVDVVWDAITAALAQAKRRHDASGTTYSDYQLHAMGVLVNCIEATSPTEELFFEALETAWFLIDEIGNAAPQDKNAGWRKDILSLLRVDGFEKFEQCFNALAIPRRLAREHPERVAELKALLRQKRGIRGWRGPNDPK